MDFEVVTGPRPSREKPPRWWSRELVGAVLATKTSGGMVRIGCPKSRQQTMSGAIRLWFRKWHQVELRTSREAESLLLWAVDAREAKASKEKR
jgi:hypothetical protein